MAINYDVFDTTEDYIGAVVELISRVEGYRPTAKNIGDGKATIGYGYTFNRKVKKIGVRPQHSTRL